MKKSYLYALIIFFLSLVARLANGEGARTLSFSGPSSVVTGECLPLTLSRSQATASTTVILSGWTTSFGVFRASDCRSQFVPSQTSVAFAAGQTSLTLYVGGYVAPGQPDRQENVDARDLSGYFVAARTSVLVKGPALRFSGPSSAISGQCVQVKLSRLGTYNAQSAPVRIGGWNINSLYVFQSADCRGPNVLPNASVYFASGSDSIALSFVGIVRPGEAPRMESLTATDPARLLSSASQGIKMLPPALLMSGASSQVSWQCLPITIERAGMVNPYSSRLTLSGWNPSRLQITQSADCRSNAVQPNSTLYWQTGQTSMVLYAMGWVMVGEQPMQHTIRAADVGLQYTPASFSLQILPPSYLISGPSALVQGECRPIRIQLPGSAGGYPASVVLSGWSPYLKVTLASDCARGYLSPMTRLQFPAGSDSLTVYVSPIGAINYPPSETIAANGLSAGIQPASLVLSIQPRPVAK